MKKVKPKKTSTKKATSKIKDTSITLKITKNSSILDKALARTLKEFPKTVKHKEKVAKEKARIRKNFEKARFEIFGTRKKNIFG